ncbi:MAG TPA: cyclase family protein [Streptosporangiaceae bacterium]
MTTPDQAQFRAELDFEITFANGGSLSGEGFRIDIARPDLTDDELGAALIADLGLLMADDIRITRRRIFPDRHKRAATAPVTSTAAGSSTVSGSSTAPGSSTGPADPAVRYADLSHAITDGLVTVPGFPVPRIRAQSVSAGLPPGRYAPGVSFAIGEISMCGNTSTYLDSPRHLLPDGADLAALPLDRLAGLDGIVVDVTGMDSGRAIGAGMLLPYDVAGKAVLLRTGWDARWGTAAYQGGYPFLTAAAARHLVSAGAVLVGIDAPNIDDTDDPERPGHAILLGAGLGVCEHLTGLAALPGAGFRFTAVPPKVAGFGTFPVRAYATWTVSS